VKKNFENVSYLFEVGDYDWEVTDCGIIVLDWCRLSVMDSRYFFICTFILIWRTCRPELGCMFLIGFNIAKDSDNARVLPFFFTIFPRCLKVHSRLKLLVLYLVMSEKLLY
jgi:hypothetical protein